MTRANRPRAPISNTSIIDDERVVAIMASDFKDHFSGASGDYQRNRPTYPAALFEFLAAQSPARQCAWDCATGTGQAAQRLARYFDRVIATDGSATQIDSALADQ